MKTHNTLHEQREIILEILRTRSTGGGTPAPGGGGDGGGGLEGPPLPITGEAFVRAFGVPVDRGDPESAYRETREGWSRRMVEWAVQGLAWMDPQAFAAINEVFNLDTGGYRDLEHYEQKGKDAHARRTLWCLLALGVDLPRYSIRDVLTDEEVQEYMWRVGRLDLPVPYPRRGLSPGPLYWAAVRQATAPWRTPEIAHDVHRGIWLVLAKLPASKFPLEVRFSDVSNPEALRREGRHHAVVYAEFKSKIQDHDTGNARRLAIVQLADEYGVTERRIEQIIALEREKEGLPKRAPGRPRKAEA